MKYKNGNYFLISILGTRMIFLIVNKMKDNNFRGERGSRVFPFYFWQMPV